MVPLFFGPDSPVSSIVILLIIAGLIIYNRGGMGPQAKANKAAERQNARSEAEKNLSRLTGSTRKSLERLLAEDRIIEAVRDVRSATGLGLKEAKDVVDLMREGPPPGTRLH